ncbi:hypothetical protein Nepgr_024521 [Nepenthes gracilis]|uniref:SP-RING-type domain-containing protein n=1 Tax=Nepenthes gracilis TaxID=150966 RepID=A0AAD3XYV9_NEPGR|nr:hypothetical protein Nepgr_024521 [Nepenthes gracilis]
MDCAAISATPAAGIAAFNARRGSAQSTTSEINSHRIGIVAERLAMCALSGQRSEYSQFLNLSLSLARGIDFAVASNDVPARASDLPPLVKQACHCKTEFLLQAALMVLMISVKNACKNGWFNSKDTEELLALADEIGSSFSTAGNISNEPTSFLPTVSNIMSRFYPQFKLGQIIVSFEIKPGYGAHVVDFHISKNMPYSPQEKIWLFVALKDNIDTSSCIVNPLQVNFLINGKGVEKRTNVMMDQGPQLPTVINTMLKYGTNLLQAVGHSEGHYIVLVAFMNIVTCSDLPPVRDYAQLVSAALDSDSEIIEGPSRISLNCPISRTRIITPVKGHQCKHHQCFDLSNYIQINSRRPAWRCPCCNQSVCYTDICINQCMVKILQEVSEDVIDVIISADGSWNAATSSTDHRDEPREAILNPLQEGLEQQESYGVSNDPPDVCDLTRGDDDMAIAGHSEREDCKPVVIPDPQILRNTSEVDQSAVTQIDDQWSPTMLLPASISLGTISQPLANFVPQPVLTDAVSPALNRDHVALWGMSHATNSMSLSQLSTANSLALQQPQFGQANLSSEYGRSPAITRNVTRTPIAIQALPVQPPTPSTSQWPRPSLNPSSIDVSSLSSQNSLLLSSVADGSGKILSDMERRPNTSQSYVNPLQVPDVATSSSQRLLAAQTQLLGLPAPAQLPRLAQRVSSGFQTRHPQQPLNASRLPQTMSQPPHLMRPASIPRTHVQPRPSPVMVSHTASSRHHQFHLMAAAVQRAAQMARQPPTVPQHSQSPVATEAESLRTTLCEPRLSPGGQVQAVSRTENLIDLQLEQNWRPTGRMRGSLSGRSYSDSLNPLIIRPTEQSPALGPPISNSMPPHLQSRLANSRNAHVPQTPTHPVTSG